MPSKKTRYTRLETDEDNNDSEDEAPPEQVHLNSSQYHVTGSRWNHIENLDEFFDRVYHYQWYHGLSAIVLNDILELFQFAFMCLFSAFILTCLRFDYLFADVVKTGNDTSRNVELHDLIDVSRLANIHPLLIFVLFLALLFWFHRLCKTIWRFVKFWEIRSFYHDVLRIPTSQLRNYTWSDVLDKLKEAQREFKMNIRKQELTELDVHHRILRFKNYLVAMINKKVLPCKIWVPFYGEKVFCSLGLKYNYEMLLFWGPGAPFKNNYYLHEGYKSASKKYELVQKLRFRISILALINLIFCPFILLYQILYSFFSYAELLKRQPGVFGRRRWSLYGKLFLRHFNELDHELELRLNKAYEPAVMYMDTFVSRIATIMARNIAFVTGSLFAVLFTMTVIQEDLLTAHNVLTFLTALGVIITVCRVFIPDEHHAMDPKELMEDILKDIHYMPDYWKDKPHTLQVSSEFSQVFQFTMMYLLDELLSPLVTPFVLYFLLRNKSAEIVDFLRNFTVEVSGVGDVCSFAEMNLRKHGHPEWQHSPLTRANTYERANLGKTELSLVQFAHKNPKWEPGEDAALFMSQMKESVEMLHSSLHTSHVSSSYSRGAREDDMGGATSHMGCEGGVIVSHPTGSDSMTTSSLWGSAVSNATVLSPLHLHQLHQSNRKLNPQVHERDSYQPPMTGPQPAQTELTLYDPYSPSDSSEVTLETAPPDPVAMREPLLLREEMESSQ